MSDMQIITRKPIVKELVEECLLIYESKGVEGLVKCVHKKLLCQKIKFPLLEYAAQLLYDCIPEKEQVVFCDQIESYKTMGGNVLLGIVLQKRLHSHYDESIRKAAEYISKADAWYICDIIGERVFGVALLNDPQRTLPIYKQLAQHPSQWVVRSLGAGGHYAIKKGLSRNEVSQLFELLLSLTESRNKEIKQGIGWAAKTTAKFHPDIIEKYQDQIQEERVGQWFRGKIKIGLNRHYYAQRNSR